MCDEIESVEIFERVTKLSEDEEQVRDAEKRVEKLQKSLCFMREQMGESELTCPICLGDCINPRRPEECPHIACQLCLDKHLEANKFCPICRATVSTPILVNQDTLKKYYFDRLERNINDGVAWYHLTKLGIRSTDKNTKAYEAAITVELVGEHPDIITNVGLCCAALSMRNSPNVAQDQWNLLASEFCFALCHIRDSPTRRELLCDLGGKYGMMNALQVTTEALSTSPPSLVLFSSFYNPWMTILKLMCREYVEEIANGTFSVSVRGKSYSALELTEAVLSQEGEDMDYFGAAASRYVYVCYLTKSMRKVRSLMLQGVPMRVEPSEMISLTLQGNEHVLGNVRAEDYFFLALGWRESSSRALKKIMALHPTASQEDFWGKAVTRAMFPHQAMVYIEAMLPSEMALINGELFDRAALLTKYAC